MTSISLVPKKPVAFGSRLAASATFDVLFRDGMALVEETAAYLDGPGRDEARHLSRIAALAYASESMRLTTRLMQIASWLLLQRAVNDGEMSLDEAEEDKRRSRAAWQGAPAPAQDPAHLPKALVALMDGALDLQKRIQRLDAAIDGRGDTAPSGGGISAHLAALHRAFPGA